MRVDGGGALLVTGHLGNLELGAVMLRVLFDDPLTAVVLPERDPGVNELRREMRACVRHRDPRGEGGRRHGAAHPAPAGREPGRGARRDRALGRDRVEVEFFGRPTGFLRSPALLGYATGAPLVPAFILRQADGRYAGFASDPIRVARTGDRDANVQAAMQAFARVLEKQVRAYPHLWYQFYPYWGGAGERRSLHAIDLRGCVPSYVPGLEPHERCFDGRNPGRKGYAWRVCGAP